MSVRFLIGDCRELLRTLPDASVHCVVTSPPYWGLRDYGIDGQMGLETSFSEHIDGMVDIFREVRRILRSDGTLWLNYGDSYATSVNGRSAADTKAAGNDDRTFRDKPFSTIGNGLKPKDLCGIPWRVAFALQADGWWLRQDIIWSKPNPMPESVTDRCTKAHEYLFLLTKRERYFYDATAISESATDRGDPRQTSYVVAGERHGANANIGNGLYKIGTLEYRNKRSVWEIATAPFSEAHFATFPPALIEPCIQAGTSEKGCCAKCAAPWVRQIERSSSFPTSSREGHPARYGDIDSRSAKGLGMPSISTAAKTIGWSPSCKCDAAVVPCTVLDPFAGAGTTGLVADRLQRSAILIELNPTYAEMARRRILSEAPLFFTEATTGEAAFKEGMRAVLIEREAEYQDDIRRRMKLVLGGPDERRFATEKEKQKKKPIDAGPLFSFLKGSE